MSSWWYRRGMCFGFRRISISGNIAGNTEKECMVLKKINAEWFL